MTAGKGLAHLRDHDHEAFDEITFKVVPRWKESELSGDQWRTSVAVVLKSNGLEVAARAYRDMDTALALAPAFIVDVRESGRYEEALRVMHARDEHTCDQPGCAKPWTVKLKLKRRTSARGEWLDPSESAYYDHFRQFCGEHRERGDCSREDCDENYEAIEWRNT